MTTELGKCTVAGMDFKLFRMDSTDDRLPVVYMAEYLYNGIISQLHRGYGKTEADAIIACLNKT